MEIKTMLDSDSMLCPFCGGEMDERGGQCNYKKKTMTIDLKCKQCETVIKFKTKWQENPYREAIEAFNRRAGKDAVPVVRCRECRHFNMQEMECENDAISTDHEGGASYSLNFYLDDFCSYGERKEGTD